MYNDCYDELYIDDRKIDKSTKFEWEDDVTYKIKNADVEIMAKFMGSSALPALFISTDTGSMEQLNLDKNYSERGKIDIFGADGSISYSGGLSLKGRGNTTYGFFEKKPFNIKLDDAAGILGMNMDKDWALLANSWDYSYMNNKLAFDMASKAGFDYVPEAEYADVYFNGDYWGIYLVAERVEVDENRIDITDLKKKNQEANPDMDISAAETFDYGNKRGVYLDNVPDDITGGYLLERDYRLDPNYEGTRKMTTSYFETQDFGTCISIKSPEYASEEEVDYICDLTNEMEQAITSPDGYSESGEYYLDYIDLDSWVKWYMVAEIAYDLDKDKTNTYFYKDRDEIDTKFYIGPIWDYDNRFGGTKSYASAEILTKLELGGGWVRYLYEKPEFFNAVCQEWNAYFKDYLREDAQRNIDLWQEEISRSVKMDNVRWYRGAGYPVMWPSDGDAFVTEYDFNDEVEHLRNWVSTRCDFLDTYWGKEG